MSQMDIITDLLGIQGWEVVENGVERTDEEIIVHIERTEHTGYQCAGCNQPFMIAYDHLPQRMVRDFPAWGRRCYLSFSPARVACPDCGTHTEALEWIEPRERHTLRFEKYVASLCSILPVLDVAAHLEMDKNAVYRIDRKWLGRREQQRQHRPVRYLGIDEISVQKGMKFATLFYDLERREVIGGVRTRRQRAVSGFFRRWGKEACKQVVAVCADLWTPYHASIKRYLKKAVLVFDKFHVFKYLSEAIDATRRDEQNNALCDEDKALIKGTRWLWLRKRHKLRRKQKVRLDEIMAVNENLQKAYLLKEDFEGFYESESAEEASAYLEAWTQRCNESELKHFKKLARRLNRWKQGILAHYEHPINNGVAEGLNNKIKVLKRRSYGFHDFAYFILKIMDITGALPPLSEVTHT